MKAIKCFLCFHYMQILHLHNIKQNYDPLMNYLIFLYKYKQLTKLERQSDFNLPNKKRSNEWEKACCDAHPTGLVLNVRIMSFKETPFLANFPRKILAITVGLMTKRECGTKSKAFLRSLEPKNAINFINIIGSVSTITAAMDFRFSLKLELCSFGIPFTGYD